MVNFNGHHDLESPGRGLQRGTVYIVFAGGHVFGGVVLSN